VTAHEPAVRPGAHLVAAELGVEDPWMLSDRHPPGAPLNVAGRLVAVAAEEVDDLHEQLVREARSAIGILAPYARGENANAAGTYGLLRGTGPQIELLGARRGAAYQHLTRAMAAYQRLLPELDHALGQAAEQVPGRGDDWAVSGDRQLRALRAVEHGGLRLKQSALSEQDRYLSDGTGVMVPVWAQTVERMLADGLLDIDTSTRPTHGQLLSLTPLGRETLQAADHQAPADRAPLFGATDAPPDPALLPTAEELTALEQIKNGNGARISTATVEALETKDWIERDTSADSDPGQALSLTRNGEAAYAMGQTLGPRISAALSRCPGGTRPSPAPQTPPPGTTSASRPTRTC
jgi:hypothetical protein